MPDAPCARGRHVDRLPLIIGKIPCIRESPRVTKDGLRNLIANLGTDRVTCHAMVPPFLYAGKIPVIWEASPLFRR
jgi:hypothetical protein